MKRLTIEEALSFLPAIEQGNGVAISMFKGKPAKTKTKVIYIAGTADQITANNGLLILPSDNKKLGYNNFDKGNTFNVGRNLEVIGMRFRFDVTVGAGVTPLTAKWNDAAPVAFLNGDLQITQDGTSGYLFDGPIGPFVKTGTAITTLDEFLPIIPFMFRETSPINIQALLAIAGTATHAWKVEFLCLEYTAADQA